MDDRTYTTTPPPITPRHPMTFAYGDSDMKKPTTGPDSPRSRSDLPPTRPDSPSARPLREQQYATKLFVAKNNRPSNNKIKLQYEDSEDSKLFTLFNRFMVRIKEIAFLPGDQEVSFTDENPHQVDILDEL